MTSSATEPQGTDAADEWLLDPDALRSHARPSMRLAPVLHVCRADWHGIRSATAALPGHKLLLPSAPLSDQAVRQLCDRLDALSLRTVCFQGYSPEADILARGLRSHLGPEIGLYAVSHVTSTQFQAPFEIRMQAALRQALQDGVFQRLGSVKPGFADVMPEVWPETILNFCPAVPMPPAAPEATGQVFIPLENHWRKGLYTNMIAALRLPEVLGIYSVNAPTHLELTEDLGKVQVTGFLEREALYALMARVDAVMNVSLAECQPMTQLEAFALGRPCLTGPLGLTEFARDEIIERCTVSYVDTPSEARRKLADLLDLWRRDGAYVQDLIADHIRRRHALAEKRYGAFLEL